MIRVEYTLPAIEVVSWRGQQGVDDAAREYE